MKIPCMFQVDESVNFYLYHILWYIGSKFLGYWGFVLPGYFHCTGQDSKKFAFATNAHFFLVFTSNYSYCVILIYLSEGCLSLHAKVIEKCLQVVIRFELRTFKITVQYMTYSINSSSNYYVVQIKHKYFNMWRLGSKLNQILNRVVCFIILH